MKNIGVVILNYLAYEATITCVECFKEQQQSNVNLCIVVVDNASDNGSYEVLQEKYKDDRAVHVFRTDKNLGFAKGNNFGYKKLCEIMECDYVIISNDDIILKEKNLFQWIIECDEKYQFGVLGPKIYSVRGEFYQSPCSNYTRKIWKCYKNKLFSYRHLLKLYIKKILGYKYDTMIIHKWDNEYYNEASEELTLHGSFQIFSKKYFDYYVEPYNPDTFLYQEEDILKLRCDRKNLPMIYSPAYMVEHLQAFSSSLKQEENLSKEIFRTKQQIKSLGVYMKELKS